MATRAKRADRIILLDAIVLSPTTGDAFVLRVPDRMRGDAIFSAFVVSSNFDDCKASVEVSLHRVFDAGTVVVDVGDAVTVEVGVAEVAESVEVLVDLIGVA